MRDVLFIAGKDLRFQMKARETIMWVFIMPIVFFYFIGTVTSGFGGGADSAPKIAVWTEEAPGFLFDQLVLRLEDNGYQVVRPDSVEEFARYSRQLTVPAHFTDSLLAGVPVTLEFENNSDGLTEDYNDIKTRRAAYTVLADLAALSEAGDTPTPQRMAALNAMPRTVTIDVKPAGVRKEAPHGFQQSVPGILVMFVLLTMVTSGAVLLLIERRQGLLRRLAYTPIPRRSIVVGKLLGKFGVGVVQVAFGMVAGTLLFKVDWGPDLPMVIIVLMAYAASMAALGVVLGSIARTEGQVIGIGVIATNVLGALGGCWWPIEITPGWMQKLQLALPTGWAMDALHRLISFGDGPTSVLPHVAVMSIATVALIALGGRVFRFE